MGLSPNQTMPGQQGNLLARGCRSRSSETIWGEGMGKCCKDSSRVRKVGWDRWNLPRLDRQETAKVGISEGCVLLQTPWDVPSALQGAAPGDGRAEIVLG